MTPREYRTVLKIRTQLQSRVELEQLKGDWARLGLHLRLTILQAISELRDLGMEPDQLPTPCPCLEDSGELCGSCKAEAQMEEVERQIDWKLGGS
jgi:hypothetical protein